MGELDRKHMVTLAGMTKGYHGHWQQVDRLNAPDLEKILEVANGKYTDEEKSPDYWYPVCFIEYYKDYLLKETPSPELIERQFLYG